MEVVGAPTLYTSPFSALPIPASLALLECGALIGHHCLELLAALLPSLLSSSFQVFTCTCDLCGQVACVAAS